MGVFPVWRAGIDMDDDSRQFRNCVEHRMARSLAYCMGLRERQIAIRSTSLGDVIDINLVKPQGVAAPSPIHRPT